AAKDHRHPLIRRREAAASSGSTGTVGARCRSTDWTPRALMTRDPDRGAVWSLPPDREIPVLETRQMFKKPVLLAALAASVATAGLSTPASAADPVLGAIVGGG